ncbi:MAG: hypothetical protein JRI44_13335 [Deltaproteobacteria bacterium]|nr:hypothetical protein [Deltaproteobacteria bacterium]
MGSITFKFKHKTGKWTFQCTGCGGISYFAPYYVRLLQQQGSRPKCQYCGGRNNLKKVKYVEKADIETNDLWARLAINDPNLKKKFPANTWKKGIDVK